MKKILFLWGCLFLNMINIQSTPPTYSLKEAINRKLISVSITGSQPNANRSRHYGDCMETTIKNLSNYPFQLELQTGTLLPGLDSNYQTMLVTKNTLFDMPAKSTVKKQVFAMCSQMRKKSPSTEAKFTVGEMANDKLKKLAHMIEHHNLQNSKGQNAVWALTDGLALAPKSYNTSAEKMIFSYASIHSKNNNIVQETVKITFENHFQKAGKISVKIIDANGNHFKTIVANQPVSSGSQTLNFWLSNNDFPKGKYKAILFFDGMAVVQENFVFK